MRTTLIVLCVLPSLAFAITDTQKEAFNQANIKALEEQGLPTPDSGVQLVPQASMRMQDWQKTKAMADTKEMNSKGYVNKSSMRAHELIHIKNQIRKTQPKQAMMYKGTDSHLRQRAEDIPFSYSYIGTPKEEMTEFYGIAPVETYVLEPQSGWTGVVEFFKTSFAHCAYTENNMIAAHGAARIAQEEARSDVNGKITLIDIEGNESTGYLYRVNWFDNIFNHNLECATKNFSEATRTATINLAKKIDIATA